MPCQIPTMSCADACAGAAACAVAAGAACPEVAGVAAGAVPCALALIPLPIIPTAIAKATAPIGPHRGCLQGRNLFQTNTRFITETLPASLINYKRRPPPIYFNLEKNTPIRRKYVPFVSPVPNFSLPMIHAVRLRPPLSLPPVCQRKAAPALRSAQHRLNLQAPMLLQHPRLRQKRGTLSLRHPCPLFCSLFLPSSLLPRSLSLSVFPRPLHMIDHQHPHSVHELKHPATARFPQ